MASTSGVSLEKEIQGNYVITKKNRPDGLAIAAQRASSLEFSGAGGGGSKSGSSRTSEPEEPETLRSISTAQILIAIGEGPLEGPISGDLSKDTFVNGIPLRSPNGELNYQGFNLEYRNGTPDQEYIEGLSAVERDFTVGKLVKKDLPITEPILNEDIDAARVTVRFPALRELREEDGRSIGSSVAYSIEVQPRNQSYEQVMSDTLSGKTTSNFERQHVFSLPGESPWNIRLVRNSDDSQTERISNEIFFQTLTHIENSRKSYPDIAVSLITIDARQFNSKPTVQFLLKGLRMLVPHNYDTDNGEFNGFFDGSLRESWCNCPVWILMDLLTDTRYGAKLDISRIDLASFYEASVYCNERVSNGEGGEERRWVFNGTIDTAGDAFQIAEAVASTFHGLLYWSGSKVRLSVDKRKTPVRNYSYENVIQPRNLETGEIEGRPFRYTDISDATIHSVAIVSYREPNSNYEIRQVKVVDDELLAKYGYRPVSITAMGCTSRTQAYRFGNWRLKTEKIQQTSVTYSVSREGMLVGIGDVVNVFDEEEIGEIRSGRIVAADSNSITVDRPPTLETTGVEYSLFVAGEDGRSYSYPVNIGESERYGDLSSQLYRKLVVDTPFESVPAEDTVWGLSSNALTAQQFSVNDVSQDEADGSYSIEALQYEPGKYDTIENGVPLVLLETFGAENIYAIPKPVEDIQVDESLFSSTGSSGVRVRAEVSWAHANDFENRSYEFRVETRLLGDTEWQPQGISASRNFDIFDLAPGVWDFRVTAISPYGIDGESATKRVELYGLTTPPTIVIGLEHQFFGSSLLIRWDKSTDLDVRLGGDVLIYYSPLLGQIATPATAALLTTLPGDQTQYIAPPSSGTYFLAFRDSAGNSSEEFSRFEFNGVDFIDRNIAVEVVESPDFSGENFDGVKTNLEYNSALSGLILTDTSLGQGIYDFEETVDFGSVLNVRVTPRSVFIAFSNSEVWDSAPGLFDARPSTFDGADSTLASGRIEFRYSNDGISYTPWAVLVGGDYRFRFCQLRAVMTVTDPAYNVVCQLLVASFDVPDLIQEGAVTSNANGTTSVQYTRNFFTQPVLALSPKGMQSGDYVEYEDESNTGFSFSVRDSANNRVARLVNYIAKGF